LSIKALLLTNFALHQIVYESFLFLDLKIYHSKEKGRKIFFSALFL